MNQSTLPDAIADLEQLDEVLSRPTEAAARALAQVEGDILVLGVAGKMGPTLARMAKRAGPARHVLGVSRFSDPAVRRALESQGIETIEGDLLQPGFLDGLPDAPNVIFMAAMKFGTVGREPWTWAMNVYLPAMVCRRFARSRIVAFSTGNVYPLVPARSAGSVETDPPGPCGEYAMSALGRERIFEYFSRTCNTRMALVRLNYAVEMRYGVLVDLAQKVADGQVIDLSMGYVNVIWQGDAAAMALAMLADVASPPLCLNVAGPERLGVRAVCERFGQLMGKPVRFTGVESADALLSNGQAGWQRYGMPRVDADRLIGWIAHWLTLGGPTLGRPTHFEVRNGNF